MRLALVLGLVGRLLRVFSPAFLPPALLALHDGANRMALEFVAAGAAAFAFGTLMGRRRIRAVSFRRSEALAVVSFTWLVVAAFAAVPYLMVGLSPVDALFESMSGFTTTGATIFTEQHWQFDRALFLWRAMTQWFGGVGVIALFIVVLPHLGVGGRQLFFAEASFAPSESIAPKIQGVATRIWILYVFLTLLQTSLLFLMAGMPFFDSACHALTTMPAGGFSPNPASIAGYADPAAFPGYDPAIGEWIITVFMLLAGMSFPLLWVGLVGRPWKLFQDGEARFYMLATLLGAAGVALVLAQGLPDLAGVRTAMFQCASLISSTGYASTDYNLWADGARVMLIFVMLVGGCAGSAAGGAKSVRHLIALKYLYRELTRVLHPRAVIPLRHKAAVIPEAILRAVLTVVALYLAGYLLCGTILVLLGADLVTGFTASLACLGNIGPGFGPAGPMGSFGGFDSASKLVLVVAMWCGRLEVVTVLALLHPDVLRKIRWRGQTHPM
ncbi:MAG: TrkH family potassium uptake protein [Planctomycetes bacterium]|nr:TrkH family potassium uptake protein [Planctomycetota bacterium]MBL7008313.1 TrkH family potassium uptake protein [Planctomycetota bacterium]